MTESPTRARIRVRQVRYLRQAKNLERAKILSSQDKYILMQSVNESKLLLENL